MKVKIFSLLFGFFFFTSISASAVPSGWYYQAEPDSQWFWLHDNDDPEESQWMALSNPYGLNVDAYKVKEEAFSKFIDYPGNAPTSFAVGTVITLNTDTPDVSATLTFQANNTMEVSTQDGSEGPEVFSCKYIMLKQSANQLTICMYTDNADQTQDHFSGLGSLNFTSASAGTFSNVVISYIGEGENEGDDEYLLLSGSFTVTPAS